MSFSSPPRKVPARALFDRTTTLVCAFFAVLFIAMVVTGRSSHPAISYGIAIGVALFAVALMPISAWRNRPLLELLRKGEVVNARLVSFRFRSRKEWFAIEDFHLYWEPPQPRRDAMGTSQPVIDAVSVECEFEFTAGSAAIRGRDTMMLDQRSAAHAVEPVIYLPSNPTFCRFVRSLPLSMQLHLVGE